MSYRSLLGVRGAVPLAAAMLLSRLGGIMWQIALVLFVLQRFHSPGLAGLVGMVGLLPGLLLSPLAGALLDRHGRVPMMLVDFSLAACTGIALWVLSAASVLTPFVLLVVVGVSSLTLPLGSTGARSLVPLMVPRSQWDRANGVDLAIYRVASIGGPALAWVGGGATLALIGGIWLLAGGALLGVREPRVAGPDRGHILADAWSGLRYVLGNRLLRGIAFVWTLANVGSGLAIIAVPVMVLGRLHGRPVDVGLVYSVAGAAGLLSNLVAGSVRTEEREHRVIACAVVVEAFGLLVVAAAGAVGLAAVIIGMVVNSLATGFGDVAMFGLRQRAASPEWLGRAMSISMMLNSVGAPIGSALAGPAVALGAAAALVGAAGVTLVGSVVAGLGLRPGRAASQEAVAAVLKA